MGIYDTRSDTLEAAHKLIIKEDEEEEEEARRT